MTPDQMRQAQLQSTASTVGGVGKIAPEMKALLVRQAGEAAEEQAATDIDAHNAKIERQQRHADEARELADKLKPAEKPAAAAAEKHAHHKGKGR